MTIKNELTINYATDTYKLLLNGLNEEGDLTIKITQSTPVDVTFVQILHSFLEKCKSESKKVFFEINDQNEFVEALKQIGYYDMSQVLETAKNHLEGKKDA